MKLKIGTKTGILHLVAKLRFGHAIGREALLRDVESQPDGSKYPYLTQSV